MMTATKKTSSNMALVQSSPRFDDKVTTEAATHGGSVNETGSDTDPSGDWPLVKSTRFTSAWDDPVVQLDLTHTHGDTVYQAEYALEEILLNLNDAEGIHQGMRKLGEFPHFVRALKIAMNSELIRNHEGEPGTAIAGLMNHGINLIIWTLRQGKYRLADIDRSDYDKLINELVEGGWGKVLKHNQVLGKLISEAFRSPDVLRSLVGRNNGKDITVSIEDLVSRIGMPLSSVKVPLWFSDKLAELAKGKHARQPAKVAQKGKNKNRPTRGYLETALAAFNSLANQRHGGDCISFYPSDNIQGKMNAVFGEPKRSRNLSPDDAVRILKSTADWVLDLAPDVVGLAAFAREEIIKHGQPGTAEKEASYRSALADKLKQFREKHGPLVERFWPEDSNPVTVLHTYIRYVQFSATSLISVLYALRANAAVGDRMGFGLYQGCVSPVAPGSSANVIEIFLPKNPREYRSFWATKMVTYIVSILEKLRDATRPLKEATYGEPESLKERRSQKLFGHARFEVAYFHRLLKFKFSAAKAGFLKAIGLDPSVLDAQRAFRRLHCILYVYRYRDARIEALSWRLGHASIKQTEWYVTDASMTEYRKSIEKYYVGQTASLAKELKEVRSEFFQKQILDMLTGRAAGGGFSSFVGRFVKKLTRNVEFANKPVGEKAKQVHRQLEAAGYHPNDRRHGDCMLGDAATAKYGANCCENGLPRPENASLEKCNGCRNAYNSKGNLLQYERELSELKVKAQDFDLPTPVRLAAKVECERLEALVSREQALSATNRTFFIRLVEGWKDASKSINLMEEQSNG
jgi:hypothetical protein